MAFNVWTLPHLSPFSHKFAFVNCTVRCRCTPEPFILGSAPVPVSMSFTPLEQDSSADDGYTRHSRPVGEVTCN